MKRPLLFLCVALLFAINSCTKKDDPKPDATNVSITGITIVTMPLTDNGSSWDVDGDADPFFTIINASTTLYTFPNYFTDASASDLPIKYIMSGTGYKLPYINQMYGINLYDYDATSTNDFIGQIYFNPSDYKSERPASKTYTNGSIQVTVRFTWE